MRASSFSDLERYVAALEHAKTEQTPDSLAKIWGLSELEAEQKAEQLREVGFFQGRGVRGMPTYWVPFLYRDALQMIQGKADDDS